MRNKQNTSDEDSGSESDHGSPIPQIAPTPGYSLEHHDGSRSPSIHSGTNRSRSNTPGSTQTHSRSPSRSPSRPKSAVAAADSRSQTPKLQIDAGSPTGSHKSRSRSRSGSRSGSASRSGSRKSGSRSGSANSSRSGSAASNHSGGSKKSGRSKKSRSRSRSGSAVSGVSKKSGRSKKSRSRSGSAVSNSSRKSIGSRKSRSRSRSGSGSRKSRSGSRSGSAASNRSRSRSRSASKPKSDGENGSPEKRKRAVISSDSESGGGEKPVKKRINALIDTDDSEDEPQKEAGPTADALFGDADDISSEDERKKGSDRESGDDRRRDDSDRDSPGRDSDRRRSSDEEGDRRDKEPEPEPEPIPEMRIDVEIPRIVTELGKDVHFVKLPNFLSVETRPFDNETYEDEIDEEETLDEEGRQRIKLKVSNTIRWREYIDEAGNPAKDSNARMIKWSDGSMSLHLGSEIFDVYKQPLLGDHNHLFIRQGTGLQGQAVFRTKLTFRPHSTESFTHKKMTLSLADRSQKTSGIKILSLVTADPDRDRYMNLKKEEEKLRQAMRQKQTTKPKRSRDSAAHLNTSYRDHDEGSDDEGAISIAAIKNKYKKGGSALSKGDGKAAIYSSDEEGSDFEMRRSKKVDKTKALKALRDSDDEDSEVGTGTEGSGSEKSVHAEKSGKEDEDSE